MAKTLNVKKLSDTISIAECTDGFWLYDETRGMNLSMRAKSSEAAMFEALEYQAQAQYLQLDTEEQQDQDAFWERSDAQADFDDKMSMYYNEY